MKQINRFATSVVIATLVLFLFNSCTHANVTLQVKTQSGIVEGFDQDGVKTFLGIPFAAAPVGDLRWKAPVPAEKWDGIRSACAFGDDPMQPTIYDDMIFRGAQKSEDCLYLNVWTTASCVKDALPVLIYFNGGGLMAGSGSEPRYDGTSLARKGVVTVTANYREGIFGFLAHPELTAESAYGGSGNYGFLDQVAAIQWVKENISAFGGDPSRITIAGESAGSFSVSLHMVSPLSKGLISGAILSSGAEVNPYKAVAQSDAETAGKATLEGKGLNSIADARALSADSLQALLPPAGMSNVVIDSYFMTEQPDDVFTRGEQSQVPLLAGWNSKEGVPHQYLAGAPLTVENFKKAASFFFGEMTDEIMQAYGLLTDEDLAGQRGLDLPSDLFTGFPTWKVCDYQASTTDQPVYRYKFFRCRPGETYGIGEMDGAVHSADIEYAMGNLATNTAFKWTADDSTVSDLLIAYYANFCKTGNPNGEGLPEWTPINEKLDAAPVMHIDVKCSQVADPAIENGYRTLEKFYNK